MNESEVTSEDREHAKRVVYSVVYGAGEYTHTHTHRLTLSEKESAIIVDNYETDPSANRTIDLYCFKLTQ